MKLLSKLAVTLAAAVMIVACGGGGAGRTPVQPTLTRENVRDLLKMGMENSANIRGGTGGAKAHRAKSAPKDPGLLAKRAPGGRREGEDGDGTEWFEFNEYLGLWELSVAGSADDETKGSGFEYYVDQARTQPGGHDLTWVGDPSTFPRWSRTEQTYTAGNFAGEWHKTYAANNEDETGSNEGSGNIPNYGTYQYSGGWDPSGFGEWNERFDATSGAWQTYNWKTSAEGERFKLVSSNGLGMEMLYQVDGSGNGTITGPSAILPAKLAWDDLGNGTITWADGTVTEFTEWNFFGW